MTKGDTFSHDFVVDARIYQGFMDLFEDRNPLHTETRFALARGFRAEVMHGNILGGFLSYFVGECLPIKSVVLQTQEIRYLKPVYLNDKVRLTASVDERFDSVGVVEFKFHFENANGTMLAKGKMTVGLLP